MANGDHRNIVPQLAVEQDGGQAGDHHAKPPSGGSKRSHAGSRSGRNQDELSLVAKLQDEKTQEGCPERAKRPLFQQIHGATPCDHANTRKNQRQGVEKLQCVFADPLVDCRTGYRGDRAIAESGKPQAPDDR